ncbi:MAG TPA: pyridoxamine 5'-phosphate oxidase family protein [Solirubrobacteraceae bacterium]|nr:pyridoxamine 5'-phosphate oxidase family protein [Solirubrobacteraceae bacterium]
MWSEREDAIIGGDLTAALAYLTPAGGAVVTPVAPIGLRDRQAGTVTFTTSLGFGRKLERIRSNPRVALAYHAREHGFADGDDFVLVQGRASAETEPSPEVLEEQVRPASVRFMGEPKTGVFWDRWLDAYYSDRVLVNVAVERVASWPDASATGEPAVTGAPLPAPELPSQHPPAKGTGPRVDPERAAKRLRALPHVLLGWQAADGFPMVVPVRVGTALDRGITLEGPLPAGGRRAGLLGHRYEEKLIGLECRQYTGWLQDGVYAPHTESGFRAPANKTLLLLANGFLAKRGLKKARAADASRPQPASA